MKVPPPPPPASTLLGKRVRDLCACRTDQDFESLAAALREECTGSYTEYARSIVVAANDNMGFVEAQWRNQMMYRLGASTYQGLSDRAVARGEARLARAQYGQSRRGGFFGWLFG